SKFQQVILIPRNVFLLDGIGALVSSLFLVVLLAPFESFFGMPSDYVYQLAIPAFVFAVYSIACYVFNPNNWQPFMKLIALANFIYCCVTFYLILKLFYRLTQFGVLYFILEIAVIFMVIALEINTIRKQV
ncbi:MAG TPA: hypothetical protein PLX60_11410, partial [Chitinophagales bacterium]|nr:hypothetical protein [Chitinophagales bacterium]